VVGTPDRARATTRPGSSSLRCIGHWVGGASIGQAMHAAKRERIREGAPPAAWAGMVLLGDAQARLRVREASAAMGFGLALVAQPIAGFGAGHWVRRRDE
jgi:hypothetical protein